MTELAALNIKITGDSGDLTAAVNSAKAGLEGLQSTAQRAQTSLDRTAQNAATFGRSMQQASGHTANLTFQLQDIGMMLAAGQSPLMLAMQQGTQVSGIFQQMGGSVKTIGPALASAFGALVSPLSLITIGGIAAVAAITQLGVAFFTASENATALAEATEELAGATENFRMQADALRFGVDAEEVVQVRELNRLMAELAKKNAEWQATDNLGARQRISEEARGIKAQIAALQETLGAYRKAREESNLLKAANEGIKDIQIEMEGIMRRISGIDLSGPFTRMLGPIQAAIDKARELSNNMGMASGPGPNAKVPSGLLSENTIYGNVPPDLGGSRPMATSPRPQGRPFDFGLGAGAGGGGGGAGGASVNPLQAELDALQESLMTAEQLQMESYTRQQEVLNSALEQRLITQQQYQTMMEQTEAAHANVMQQSTMGMVTSVLGSMSQLFQKSKPLAIATALMNTWQGMTEALKLPFPKNIAAAATTLATGMNAVRNIRSTSSSGGGGAGGSSGAAVSAPQQNVQTLNFTLQNDRFGIGANLVRQIATQLNEAQRNGNTLIRANVL